MSTHNSNQPPSADRPRRRLVLRKIGASAPLPARSEPSPAQTTRAPRRAPETATMRPPAPAPAAASDDAVEWAVPIPLTRLHTPRPRFRSAIDFPPHGTHASHASADEPSGREVSGGSLPPLVATLPPLSAAIYVPTPSSGRGVALSHLGPAMVLASAVAIALLAILGGVAVGRRVASPAPGSASAGAGPSLTTTTVAAQAPATSVVSLESLPRATAAAPPVAPPAASPPAGWSVPAYARPAARAVLPAPVAASSAASKVAAPVRDGVKDPVSSDVGDVSVAQLQKPADVAVAPAAPEVDPLVKAVRDDIQEEEARRR